MTAGDGDKPAVAASLVRMGLGMPEFKLTALSGGISCDVWKVERSDAPPLVVKRALAKLKTKDDWRAPPQRAMAETAWFRLAGRIAPGAAPHVLGEDQAHFMFAMNYLDPACYRLWKPELLAGRTDSGFAGAVGAALVKIHAATAGDAAIAQAFANQAQFQALRIAPYLLTAATRNPGIAAIIEKLARALETARIALMHGDVSPKNILIGPDGCPVFLDAETACYGDPAFDLAFCLNHLLLKCMARPQDSAAYLDSFRALRGTYLAGVTWESALEGRAARLLGALLLARVDGKSPVEYLTDPGRQAFVRDKATRFLRSGEESLEAMAKSWMPN